MGSNTIPPSGSVRHSSRFSNNQRLGPSRRHLWQGLAWTLTGTALCAQTGCMSALTSATLREALRETATSLLEPVDEDSTPADHASLSASGRPVSQQEQEALAEPPGEQPAATKPPALTLDEAIDKAVERLSGVGGIDPATREALIETLETSHPDDWPQVVDAFAVSLEARRSQMAAREPAGAEAPQASDPAQEMPPAVATTEPKLLEPA